MRLIADLHIHSKYSRATSAGMNVEELARAAKIKGIHLLGTGDFTHPLWLKELKEKLRAQENGLFEYDEALFMLTAEVSNVFEKNGKTRKIHNIIFAPSFEIVAQINEALGKKGDLSADGRPTLNMGACELVEAVLGVSRECMVVPAHAWTPWFSLFGANFGFDSAEECFGEQAKNIYALETGLSSDPGMNWRLSALDKYALISNSDSHSTQKIGREANVFEFEPERVSYDAITNAIKQKDKKHFLMTIEFFPEEGKYHYDGHRAHGLSLAPEESRKYGNVCPVCRRRLTVGVLHRVEELADRPPGFVPETAIPFKNIVPLSEIIADALGKNENTEAVKSEYERVVNYFGNEFAVLMDATREELLKATSERVAEGVLRVREGKIKVTPGYDGVYGKIDIFGSAGEKEKERKTSQRGLGEYL
ncbi:MAG: endonuclease Q family protein [Candidatus Micrarchaeota archaeon]